MEPQIKRRRINEIDRTNPLPSTDGGDLIVGYFTGASVDIWCPKSIELVHKNGCFGSRSTTTAADSLILFLEEAFFLHHSIKCLRIVDLLNDTELDTETVWQHFCRIKPNFIVHYVAYVFLRSKNWVVKGGLKFGGHFVLYKQGPRYYHASYVVLVVDAAAASSSTAALSSRDLQGHYRIAEASKKDLLIVDIAYPKDVVTLLTDHLGCLRKLASFTASYAIPKRFSFHPEPNDARTAAVSTSSKQQ